MCSSRNATNTKAAHKMLKVVEIKKNVGELSGKFTADTFLTVKGMPGRYKWVGSKLTFELTRANVEYLREKFPTAVWETYRANEVQEFFEREADNLRARQAQVGVITPRAVDFTYKTEPMPHQNEGFEFVKDLPYFGLLWEQGLGKTKTALDVAAYKWSKGEIDTLLIMAPNGVHIQWVKEQLKEHLPDWCPRRHLPYRPERTKKWLRALEYVLAWSDGLRVFAINQEAMATKNGVAFVENILKTCKVMWIIDESPSIQSSSAARTKSVLKIRLKAKVRAILTGTPIGTGLENMYTQLSFLHQDILGYSSFYTFRNHFCVTEPVYGAPSGVEQITAYKNMDEFKTKVNAYCIRRTAEECLNLPERIPIRRNVPLTEVQRRMYSEMFEEMVTAVESGEIVTAEQAVVKLIRLQQIVCGFVKDEDGVVHRIPSNRVTAAESFVEQANGKVLVWARYHEDIDHLKESMGKYNPVVWDGRVPLALKLEAKRSFMHDDSCRVFIGNQDAAGTGLDGLQHASHTMLYYSNNFNARSRWQSEARLYRMGQKGTVIVGDLVSPGTIDLRLLKVLKQRKDTADLVLDVDFIRNLKLPDPDDSNEDE